MIDIQKLLRESTAIHDYKIRSEKTESYELFFVHQNLETVRSTDTTATSVTVYVDHDNQKGDAEFKLYASTGEDEARAMIAAAAEKALHIGNQAYELPAGETLTGEIETDFTDYTPAELARRMADAVYAADTYGCGSVNALEIFINKYTISVDNSRGIHKQEIKYSAMIEAIPTWTDGESVELYECRTFNRFDPARITADIEEKMREVRDRGQAVTPAVKPSCRVVLDTQEVSQVMATLAYELTYPDVYSQSNPYSIGDAVQKNPTGDKLTLTMCGSIPGCAGSALFDEHGTTLTDTTLIRDGEVVDYFGNHRFAQYLDRPATGNLRCMDVACGTLSDEELASAPYFRCVSMSALQLDIYNDYIGGEVRLAYYFDGEKTIPMTGISISGKLSEALSGMRLSDTAASTGRYHGPKLAAFTGIEIV